MMQSPDEPVAGLDVHKKTVVVVLLEKTNPDHDDATSTFGTTLFGLNELTTFLHQHGVQRVALESHGSVLAARVDGVRR